MYTLSAIVIHCGIGPNRGHYICIVKSGGYWLVFDDDIVDVSVNSASNYYYPIYWLVFDNNIVDGSTASEFAFCV